MNKPGLCVDFDSTIHLYSSPWTHATEIHDPPTPGAFAFLTEAVEHFTVHVFSVRSQTAEGRAAMIQWFHQHGLSDAVLTALRFPTEKPAAVVYLDDRAWQFEGTWPRLEDLAAFKPWNKRGDAPLVTAMTLCDEVLALRELVGTAQGHVVNLDEDLADIRTGLATLHYHLMLLAQRTCGTRRSLGET